MEEKKNVSENVSTNMTESTQPEVVQESDNNQENNSVNYTLQYDGDQESQDLGYWYVPESHEANISEELLIQEAS